MSVTTVHAPGTFCWLDLAAHDPEAAKRFYTAFFGWEVDDRRYGPGESDVYTMYRLDGRDVGASYAMDPAQKAQGMPSAWLSARQSAATSERAAQLRITLVRQGALDKLSEFETLCRELGLDAAAVAFMGDDLLDLPVLARAGLAATPADAVAEVRAAAHWVSRRPGGDGAVRELCELILKAQDRWEPLVAEWTPARSEP